VYNQTRKWTGSASTGDRAVVDFNQNLFVPNAVGLYTIEVCAELNDNDDQGPDNDCTPEAGKQYIFSVNYN